MLSSPNVELNHKANRFSMARHSTSLSPRHLVGHQTFDKALFGQVTADRRFVVSHSSLGNISDPARDHKRLASLNGRPDFAFVRGER